MNSEKRFVVLSGPSCVGKGPLQKAVERFYPDLLKAKPILCHSRTPRIGEIHAKDFYFLPPALIASLKNDINFAVTKVRSDWQAIDLLQIEDLLKGNDVIFAEVFHTFGDLLYDQIKNRKFCLYSIFLLPTTPDKNANEIVSIMKEKLIRRGTDKEPKLSERALSSIVEIENSNKYTHRIVNEIGEEDIEQWGEFGTNAGKCGQKIIVNVNDLGPQAKWLVETFVQIVKGSIEPLQKGKFLKFPT
jgi:guanylate kinase